MSNCRINIHALVPAIIVAVVMITISNINLGKDYSKGIIEADGKGYYAYLPAVFIYHDLNFGFFYDIERTKYYNSNHYYTYLRLADGKVVNKYFAGTALCLMPFFLAGHLAAIISGADADGYSWNYTFFTHLGAIFYLLIGLVFLRKLLKTYQISDTQITLVLLSFAFGTSLFYYTVVEFSMSHVYSFAAINAFLFCVRKLILIPSKMWLIVSGFLLGLITLIRPVNAIIIAALPFLAGSFESLKQFMQFFLRNYLAAALALAGFLLMVSVQVIIYYLQTGKLWVYSYPGEGFIFLNPHFVDFLFSYRKGLFVYTPMLLISLPGIAFIYRKSRFEAIALFSFLVILIYVLSSWHMWYYGGSFGQRVMIDFYAFFAILLAMLLKNLKVKWLRINFLAILLLTTLFCQVQTYQYRYHQIHWSDMDKTKYWEVFLRIDKLIP